MGFADSDPNFTAAQTTFEDVFDKHMPTGQQNTAIEQIAEVIPISTVDLEIQQTTGNPQLREWLGAKRFKSFRTFIQRISAKKYEASTEQDRIKIQYDKTGAFRRKIDRWTAGKAGGIANILYTKLLANPVGYDGVALFSDAHPYSSGTGDNLLLDALSHTSFNLALEQLAGFKDEDGQYWNAETGEDYLLVVGPPNRNKALEVTGSTRPLFFNASAAEATSSVVGAVVVENLNKGRADVLVIPQFQGNQWMVVNRAFGRPIIITMLEELHPETRTEKESHPRFMYDHLQYSIEGVFGTGPGMWQSVIGRITA